MGWSWRRRRWWRTTPVITVLNVFAIINEHEPRARSRRARREEEIEVCESRNKTDGYMWLMTCSWLSPWS